LRQNQTATGGTNHPKYQFSLRLLEQNFVLDAFPNATKSFGGHIWSLE